MNAFGRESVKGSSPLTRGKRVQETETRTIIGLIPAHAGKTKRRPCLTAHSTAHPRSRGENTGAGMGSLSGWGSSPLTRGKRIACAYNDAKTGLIPAHAGKTLTGMVADTDAGAHPRSRGENTS